MEQQHKTYRYAVEHLARGDTSIIAHASIQRNIHRHGWNRSRSLAMQWPAKSLILEAGGIEIFQRAGSERGEAVSCFGSRRIREREDTSVTKCPR